MPIARIELLPGRSQEIKAKMAEAITDVLINLGGGSRENCLVLFQETSAENWAIGGHLVSSPAFSQTLKAYKERTKNLSDQSNKS